MGVLGAFPKQIHNSTTHLQLRCQGSGSRGQTVSLLLELVSTAEPGSERELCIQNRFRFILMSHYLCYYNLYQTYCTNKKTKTFGAIDNVMNVRCDQSSLKLSSWLLPRVLKFDKEKTKNLLQVIELNRKESRLIINLKCHNEHS